MSVITMSSCAQTTKHFYKMNFNGMGFNNFSYGGKGSGRGGKGSGDGHYGGGFGKGSGKGKGGGKGGGFFAGKAMSRVVSPAW